MQSSTDERLTPIAWCRKFAPEMDFPTTQRHIEHYEDLLRTENQRDFPSHLRRAEIGECLAILRCRLEEIGAEGPICGANIHHHNDHTVSIAWPSEKAKTSLPIHLHIKECVKVWQFHGGRVKPGYFRVSPIHEEDGRTVIEADFTQDLEAFVRYFGLVEWIAVRFAFTVGSNKRFGIELTNTFHDGDARKFVDTVNAALSELGVIETERRTAIYNDSGHIGFISASHFAYRENCALGRIHKARIELGMANRNNRSTLHRNNRNERA